jgi:dTDP-4-amino-4,6-dideoxygalactose transaminase
MGVPFNDTRRKFRPIRDQLLARCAEVIDGGRYIGGPAVGGFERAFAGYCRATHCVGVANGSDAVELGLRGLGVCEEDAVITVANAGGYATIACQAIGAVPIYVDVDAATCQMDLDVLDRALTPSTRVVVVTHLYGLMNDVAAVRARLDRLGRSDVLILEDCAQAHGAALRGARAGSIGDAAAFSFYPTKNLGGIGDAGAVVCQDEHIAALVRSLAQYGWGRKYEIERHGGRNSRLDPIQAVVLEMQLGSLDCWNERRRQVCAHYADSLPDGWSLVRTGGEDFVGHLAVAIAPDEPARKRARAVLAERDIGHDVHYPILDCDQPAWRSNAPAQGVCELSRDLTGRIVSLPCFPELSASEIEQVADALRSFT